MRYSQLLIPTAKEVPAEAEIPSHQLMIRAGYIRKVASGTYLYLLLGWRSLRKIMEIIRQEMDAAGAQEVSAPILQPHELWRQTGRDVDYGPNLCVFEDRHGRRNALAPTAEEVITSIVAAEVSSYKQLPINLYQINEKFRDEFRPRFGVLRSREFIMKDAYSFDADSPGLDKSYQAMYDAYCRIFERCGVKYVVVLAESGEIGGTGSQEFMVPTPIGEDVIVHTADGSYVANIEKAEVDPLPKAAPIASPPAMEEVHTPNVGSIDAVCNFLKTTPAEMIKTLIYSAGDSEEHTYVALVRGDHEVNEAKLRHFAEPGTRLAGERAITVLTGAAVGFAGPMGLAPKATKLVIDHAVAAMAVGTAGANKSNYHMRNVVPGRDFPLAGDKVIVADIRNAVEGDTYQGKALTFSRGIEVGHVFKLGAKYSTALGATFTDETGVDKPCLMGCYGIGVNRILASAIELYHDENGIVLPAAIAPFEVIVLSLNNDKPEVVAEASRIHDALAAKGVDVLLDDRDARPGVKFKDADLIGIPVRIVVGERALKEGNVEIKRRTDAKASPVAAGQAVERAIGLLRES
jgi:prolyl-tRNA synthetase